MEYDLRNSLHKLMAEHTGQLEKETTIKSHRKFEMILSALNTVKRELRGIYQKTFLADSRIKRHKLLEVKHINNIIKSLNELEKLKDEENIVREDIENKIDQTKYLSLLQSLRDANYESDKWIDTNRLISFPKANYNHIFNLKTEIKEFKEQLGYEQSQN